MMQKYVDGGKPVMFWNKQSRRRRSGLGSHGRPLHFLNLSKGRG